MCVLRRLMKTCEGQQWWKDVCSQRQSQPSNSRLSSLQCYLFAYFSVWRNSKSFLAFALVCLSNMYLYELRNMWQILFHVAVGAFMTLQIRLRQPLGKAPDYNVWQKQPPHQMQHKLQILSVLPGLFGPLFCPTTMAPPASAWTWRNFSPYRIIFGSFFLPIICKSANLLCFVF